MAEQAAAEQPTATATSEQAQGKKDREKSTIQFAYLDLDDAFDIASGVHRAGGTNCSMDQLAGELGVKTDTGSFRLRLSAAKLFGFITVAGGMIALTALGIRVCDPQQQAVAKGEAFLNVPLYRQIYEQFKGGILPNQTGLESAMVTAGVAPKQSTTARQVFARSAQQAGFFQHGNNRLIPPRGVSLGGSAAVVSTTATPETPGEKPPLKNGGNNGGSGGGRHQLIVGLIDTLPDEKTGQEKTEWPLEARKEWLEGAAAIFNLIYKNPDKGTLSIEVK